MIILHTSAGRFQLDPARRRLSARDRPLELGSRALDLLLALVARAGQVVTKEDLLDRVWAGRVVEEGNLPVQVSALRRLLGRDAIATVPGRGYQFVAAVEGAPPSASRHTGELTAPPPITGRELDLASVSTLMEASRLVTVTGAGGSGKTLLARHLQRQHAGRHRHGGVWVDLRDVVVDGDVPAAAASALDLTIGRGSANAVAAALRSWDLLLVIDNAEHVLGGAAALVAAVQAVAPGVRMLVTSQAPLKLPGERVHLLRGLDVPAQLCPAAEALRHGAVALFVARARAASPRFIFDDRSAPDVIAVCRSLGGSALGVQLAAALLAVMPLPVVAETLARHDIGPESGAVDARMNVLHAALEWSHALLGPAEQTVFRRLAVLIGAAPLELALELVADDTLDSTGAAEALGALVERALVEAEPGERPRYRLLAAPRALALQRLHESGESGALRVRLAAAFAARGDAMRNANRDGDGAALKALDGFGSPADIGAAFVWAVAHDAAAAVRIGSSLSRVLRVAADRRPAAELLQRLLDGGELDPPLEARACEVQAMLHIADLRRREALARRGAACSANSGDTFSAFSMWAVAAECAALSGRLDDARQALTEAMRLCDPAWPGVRQRMLVSAQGTIASCSGDTAAAVRWWQQLAAINRSCGLSNVRELAALADAELVSGYPEQARRHLQEAESLLDGPREDLERITYVLPNLCAVCLAAGDVQGARAAAERGWPDARRFDADAWWADHLALLAALEGRTRTAALLLGRSDAAYTRIHGERHASEEHHVRQAIEVIEAQLGVVSLHALRAAGADPALAECIDSLALGSADAPNPIRGATSTSATPQA